MLAVEMLLAGIDLAARIDVVNGDRHVDIHAANVVDDVDKGFEVNFGVMRNLDTAQLLRRLDGAGCAAIGVGRVEFLRPIAIDLDSRVTRNGKHRRRVVLRVEAHQNRGVGTGARNAIAVVATNQKHVKGLVAHFDRRQRLFDLCGLLRIADKVLIQIVQVHARARETGTEQDCKNDKHCRGNTAALALALGRLGCRLLLDVVAGIAIESVRRRGGNIRIGRSARIVGGRIGVHRGRGSRVVGGILGCVSLGRTRGHASRTANSSATDSRRARIAGGVHDARTAIIRGKRSRAIGVCAIASRVTRSSRTSSRRALLTLLARGLGVALRLLRGLIRRFLGSLLGGFLFAFSERLRRRCVASSLLVRIILVILHRHVPNLEVYRNTNYSTLTAVPY